MTLEQLDSAEGVVLRSSPTPQEWQRTRMRLLVAAALCVVVGAAISLLELRAGLQLVLLEVLPAVIGIVWAGRFLRTFLRAHPTAVVATSHSLRLERLDGSRKQSLDLAGVSAIRIGPDGFSVPWRWMKGPRDGLVVVRLRATGQGLAIPPQLADHPVVHELLGRMLAASRATGPVTLVGPQAKVADLERFALGARTEPLGSAAVGGPGYVAPITVPAAWYPDPSGLAPLRWWDGREWSEYTRETPPSR